MNIRITLLTVFIMNTAIAQETVVYRWVDENNVVHFSHKHPTDKEYAEIKVQSAYSSANELIKQDSDADISDESDNKAPDLSNYSQEEIDKRCTSAKMNLKVLNSFDRVLITDDDGKQKSLSEEEKEKQIEISNKYIDIYCNTADTNNK